jgi:hypothetical protein
MIKNRILEISSTSVLRRSGIIIIIGRNIK